MTCKCMNIKLYEEGYRCMECFAEYVPKYQLNEAISQLNHIRSDVANLILNEFSEYAPEQPPINIQEFMEALEVVCSD